VRSRRWETRLTPLNGAGVQHEDKPKRIVGTWYALAEEEEDSLDSQLGIKPIVLYTTSMRAVRKTFDQCNTRTCRRPPPASAPLEPASKIGSSSLSASEVLAQGHKGPHSTCLSAQRSKRSSECS
jgi:hypothetical protein